jgi:hypothetical protein
VAAAPREARNARRSKGIGVSLQRWDYRSPR